MSTRLTRRTSSRSPHSESPLQFIDRSNGIAGVHPRAEQVSRAATRSLADHDDGAVDTQSGSVRFVFSSVVRPSSQVTNVAQVKNYLA
jgi:hypothetical protein